MSKNGRKLRAEQGQFSVSVICKDRARRELLLSQLERHGYLVSALLNSGRAESETSTTVFILIASLLSPAIKKQCYSILDNNPDCHVIAMVGRSETNREDEVDRNPRFWVTSERMDEEELLMLVAKACILAETQRDNRELLAVVGKRLVSKYLVPQSNVMRTLQTKLDRCAELDATVLLTGETGTGKTTIAHLIHDQGKRAPEPFVTISCAALPRDLLESELFGHERGAFTGAVSSRPGAVELADGGTLFLDEIGDLPLDLQPKLLTFLQERWVRRLGGSTVKYPDVRIIAATNCDLRQLSKQGLFREDLLFRLSVLTLEVPALRNRKEDIPELAKHFLNSLASRRGISNYSLTPKALKKIMSYDWPGNVRELQNCLERGAAFAISSELDLEDITLENQSEKFEPKSTLGLAGKSLEEIERLALTETLRATGGDKKEAAKLLKISLKSIYNMVERYGI